jgi:DNA-binding CsgD family transcriptional regulator
MTPVLHLTPRDKLLLQLLANGKTSPELASCLEITDVDSALTELFATIGATNQAQAVAIARKRGLLESER